EMFISVAFGVLIGVIRTLFHNRWPDYLTTIIAVLGISIPSFVMATLLQYYLALKLNIFTIAGWKGFIYSLLLVIALADNPMAFIAKLTRYSMLEETNSE